jgi:hypothetical protein
MAQRWLSWANRPMLPSFRRPAFPDDNIFGFNGLRFALFVVDRHFVLSSFVGEVPRARKLDLVRAPRREQ